MTPLPIPDPRPSTEVAEKARRRTFTAEYKRQILREADGCEQPGINYMN